MHGHGSEEPGTGTIAAGVMTGSPDKGDKENACINTDNRPWEEPTFGIKAGGQCGGLGSAWQKVH